MNKVILNYIKQFYRFFYFLNSLILNNLNIKYGTLQVSIVIKILDLFR